MAKAETILIVEDEQEIRELLVDLLADQASNFLQAENGVEGLRILETEKVDLVLTDLAMPKMNGFELVRRIRASKNLIPIIVITGHADKTVANQLKAFSPLQFISKPFSTVDLRIAVQESLKINAQKTSA